ncbi:MAG: hypothetical protein RL557_701 [archaeon]|jgi:Cu+-exporting ATPase
MKKKLTIEGMHCASCAINMEKSLRKVEGVKDVTISLMTKKGFVECDEKVSEEELKKAVARVGSAYKLVKVE